MPTRPWQQKATELTKRMRGGNQANKTNGPIHLISYSTFHFQLMPSPSFLNLTRVPAFIRYESGLFHSIAAIIAHHISINHGQRRPQRTSNAIKL